MVNRALITVYLFILSFLVFGEGNESTENELISEVISVECRNSEQEKTKVSLRKFSSADINIPACKYSLEATHFSIGDPVHETITRVAAERVGLIHEIDNLTRGVFWNDDPCADLFSGSLSDVLSPSFGLIWYWDFTDAKSIAEKHLDSNFGSESPAIFSDLECPMLGRSHFGDLQFLHAMASDKNERKEKTLNMIFIWSEFVYKLSIGEIKDYEVINEKSETEGLALLLKDSTLATPRNLLRSSKSDITQMRAIGSLLHVVQDSYAKGHTERENMNEIIKFHSYVGQDEELHRRDDKWYDGENEIEKLMNTPGVPYALDASTRILTFYKEKAPWKDVKSYLEKHVFVNKAL